MKIEVESKFNIGDIKKIKGSTNQKFLIIEILPVVCSGGTQIYYGGVMYLKRDSYRLTALQSVGGLETNPQEEWSMDKTCRINEIELEN